jgi:hypothetical protein
MWHTSNFVGLAEAAMKSPEVQKNVDFSWGVKIPMRDGIHLNATVYKPKSGDPTPVIFTLTPYISDSYHARAFYFAQHGEATGGGAHPGAPYRLHSHFDVFIPDGRAINPITGTNWEGSGVTPDIPIPQAQAFKVAYSMALKSVIGELGEAASRPFNLLKEEAQIALKDLETT